MINHPQNAKEFLKNTDRAKWHDETLWMVRKKRDLSREKIPEWEDLRELASRIKGHTLSNLDQYLVKFEERAIANGVEVHWAKDDKEHNAIVLKILKENKAKTLVKSKSMLTEECGLNEYLEGKDISVVETDLGELIIQLAKEHPSHIVMPAIHKKKREISDLFAKTLRTEVGNEDPQYLTEAARLFLRNKFKEATVALTGANFGIAETGSTVVCTNEGNADMGVHAANVHIVSMGIEKVIPKIAHLGVFLRLLARSATGQLITAYTSIYTRPRVNAKMHIILVDNGRTVQLGRDKFIKSLYCIRCGACMNTCPVYRRSGGHSYGTTVPGPIGSILSPGKDLRKFSTLPFASTLCGSCTDVCPVKIDIHEQLYQWRQEISKSGNLPFIKKLIMKVASKLMVFPSVYNTVTYLVRFSQRNWKWFGNDLIMQPWTKYRFFKRPEKYSFREWYLKNKK